MYLRKCLAIRKKAYPKGHYLIYAAEGELGILLLKENKLDEAERFLLSGYTGTKITLGKMDSTTIRYLQELPVLYSKLDDKEKVAKYEKILSNLSE